MILRDCSDLLLFKIIWTTLDLLHFHVTFRVSFFMSSHMYRYTHTPALILIEISLTLARKKFLTYSEL